MNEPKRSNHFKVRHLKDWTLRDVVEYFGNISFEELVAKHKKRAQASRDHIRKAAPKDDGTPKK